ncbi:MAG: glycosyltransferase [Patescibacteria group bacterium]|nr:glycosyltransferase [Patescibacteria group bacterium]
MPTLKHGDRIMIVCDTTDGKPADQKDRGSYVQGVDRTAMNMVATLSARGYRVKLLHPYLPQFIRFRVPLYSDVEIAINPFGIVRRMLLSFKPNAIFTMTAEAPLGLYMSHLCRTLPLEGDSPPLPFTAQFHTNYDEYASIYLNRLTGGALNLPPEWFRPLLEYVYRDAHLVLVPTKTMEEKVHAMGLGKTRIWPRGVDTGLFRPRLPDEENPYANLTWFRKDPKPILLYFGRVAEEKGIDLFLGEAPRSRAYHRVVIGDGPFRETLERRFGNRPDVHFLGKKLGSELAMFVRFADVHVFPSVTDTFGNTVIEAGASGVPTVAFDAPGPHDTVVPGINGVLVQRGASLIAAVPEARKLSPKKCREHIVQSYSLDAAADTLLKALTRIDWTGYGPK